MPYKKILVVALDNLGDAVMASSVFAPLRRCHPGLVLGFWIKEYAADLFRGAGPDLVHAVDPFWDASPGRPKGRPAEFFRTLSEIRAERYDAAVLLNTEWRRSLSCYWAGIPVRIGYRRRKSRLFLTDGFSPSTVRQHFMDDHRFLAEKVSAQSIEPREAVPQLHLTTEQRAEAQSWLKAQGWANDSFAAIHPFSGDRRKCWPVENWVRLAEIFAANHPELKILFLSGQNEAGALGVALEKLRPEAIRVLSGAPLGLVKGILEQARLFAGGDSGPAHMAAALGTPVLSLFGDDRAYRCAPRGRAEVHVISRTPLVDLQVAEVSLELEKMVKTAATARR